MGLASQVLPPEGPSPLAVGLAVGLAMGLGGALAVGLACWGRKPSPPALLPHSCPIDVGQDPCCPTDVGPSCPIDVGPCQSRCKLLPPGARPTD